MNLNTPVRCMAASPRRAWLMVFMLLAAASIFWSARADDGLPCCDGEILRFRYLEGARGYIDLRRSGSEFRFIGLETMQPSTHFCTLYADRVCILPSSRGPRINPACETEPVEKPVEKSQESVPDEFGICRISVAFTGTGLRISYDDYHCRGYCGARGEFEGTYERQKRLRQLRMR